MVRFILCAAATVGVAVSLDKKADSMTLCCIFGLMWVSSLVLQWALFPSIHTNEVEKISPKIPAAEVAHEKQLPEPTYKNWKTDLNALVENEMTLDDFLDRWRGRGPDRKMNEEMARLDQSSSAKDKTKNILSMIVKARKNHG